MTRLQISKASFWFVVGAYHAGASERECSRLSGLSRAATRMIVSALEQRKNPQSMYITPSFNMPTCSPNQVSGRQHTVLRKASKRKIRRKLRTKALSTVSRVKRQTLYSTATTDQTASREQQNEWSVEDDTKLLMHVLESPTDAVMAQALEALYPNKHVGEQCLRRWEHLKNHLLSHLSVTPTVMNK